MTYMKLKKKKSYLSNLKIIMLFLILFMITFFIILEKSLNYASSFFLNYASIEAEKQISSIINESSSSDELKKICYDDLYYVTRNDLNEIEMIDYNLTAVNNILDEITFGIQDSLKALEDRKILDIPFGIIMNNPFFNNMGPNISVKLKFISSVLTSVNTKLTDYGINNSLVEISINIEVKAKVILPVVSEEIVVTNDVPVSYKVITGKIPEYYGINGISKNSNLYQLPLE